MMKQYVALLRGINVGGKNPLSMAELRQCFVDMGYEDVSTYINTGNVIFRGTEPDAQKIAKGMEIACGLSVPVCIRTARQMRTLGSRIPRHWTNDSNHKTDVLFLWPEYDSRTTLKKLDLILGVDEAIYLSGAIVWHVSRSAYKNSRMQKGFIGSSIYAHMTARNVNTVRKLAELCS